MAKPVRVAESETVLPSVPPAPAVVARYRERGIPMFSTAESGAIVIDTDGRSVSIQGWAQPGRALTVPPREP